MHKMVHWIRKEHFENELSEKEMNKKFIENLKIHDARARCSQNEMKM